MKNKKSHHQILMVGFLNIELFERCIKHENYVIKWKKREMFVNK